MGFISAISRISPSPGKVRILIATLLFLTVPFFVYYTFYVKKQTTYFTSRDLRALALLSSQIDTKVESVSGVFKNAGDQFIAPKSKEDKSRTYVYTAKDADNRAAMAENLTSLMQDGQQLVVTDFESTNNEPIGDKKAHNSAVTLDVKQGSALSLYLEYIYNVDDKKRIRIRARSDFSSLVLPLLSKRAIESPEETDSDDEFANVLIADSAANGKVIFQQDPSEFRLISLDQLPIADEEKKLDFNAIDKTSGVVDITLAGSKFKLFLHPINLSVAQTATPDIKETRWIVCGLVPAAHFQREIWAISYTVLIAFAFLPALAVLSWPFLKLMLIGPKDRLRTADIYFLMFSVLIGLSLLTSLSLYAYSYELLENQMDGQLETLSNNIRKNFQEELEACLVELNSIHESKPAQEDRDRVGFPPDKGVAVKAMNTSEEKYGRSTVFKDYQPQAYPYFDTAVWIDPQGNQRIKWTNNDYKTQFINVATRPYFSNLNEGRYRYFEVQQANTDQSKTYQFWLEPILSRTTGRNEVEISRLVPGDSRWISAFDARLLSLMQPVLPSGYGFAIIDNEGKVLFHSDETHHLGENFFQECDNNLYLLSAVQGRTETPLRVQYLGSGHRLFIAPVNNFPNWSLVVFRDKQVLRTAFLEMLTLSTLLFLFYSLILLSAVSVFYLLNVNTNARRAWLWPSRERTLTYLISMLGLLALSIISFILISNWKGPGPAIAVCFLSFGGIGFYLVNLRFNHWAPMKNVLTQVRRWPGNPRLRTRLNQHNLAYALNLSVLLLLIAIMPSFAIFKFAYESEMDLFIRHGQLTVANGLAERDERIRSRYANANSASNRDSDFINKRLDQSWDIYHKFFFNTERTEGNDQHPAVPEGESVLSWARRKANSFKPLFNRISVAKHPLLDHPFVDSSRRWLVSDGDPAALTFHVDVGRPGQTKSYYLKTAVPGFEFPAPRWWFLFLGAFIPFYLWVNLIVRKVFLLDLHKPASSSVQDWLARGMHGNSFVILDGPFTQKRILSNVRLHVVDLKGLADKSNWAQDFNYEELPAKKVIALDHFEHKLDDPEANHQKIWFLEKLLPSRRIVVISRADPTRYRFANGSQGSEDGADRWSGVTSRFLKVYAEDDGNHKAFVEQIEARRKDTLRKLMESTRSKEGIEELFETLKKECSGKAPLQQIGLGLLKQPGLLQITREHLINRVASQAHTYYHTLWDSCSNGERLTLVHLAKDRLLSPRDHDIEPLLRRGLIVRDPDLHLMNESFRRFVKAECGTQVLAEYEKAKQSSPWHNLKVPFLVALISVVLFLFITQRDIYNSSLATLTAIITVIPAVFKLLSFFQNDSVSHLPHAAP